MDAKIELVQSAPAMVRIACLFAYLGLVVGCRGDRARPAAQAPPDPIDPIDPVAAGQPPAPVPAAARTPYTSDIENLCDAVVRSGADQLAASDRPLAIASWLGGHLQTEEAHQYLVKIQPLDGEAKAVALEAEARRVGLPGCALAAEWRAPASSAR